MAVKDKDVFLEIINAIIPSLSGHDPDKLVPMDYGPDKIANSKHYGPKVSQMREKPRPSQSHLAYRAYRSEHCSL
jgi:hypothetical protein